MATFVFTDAFVSLNAVDLSDHVKSVTLDYKGELKDATAMGDTTRIRKGGLKDWSIAVDIHQDNAAAKDDATLFGLVGTTFAVIVRPDKSDAVSATNPNFTGTGILESYQPVGSELGEMSAAPVAIQAAGALTRATS